MKLRGWRVSSARCFRFLSAALLISVLVSACHHGSYNGGTTQNRQQQSSTPPIGSGGGTATSADGNATVTVPAGALSQDTQITVTTAASPPAGNIGMAYIFNPTATAFSQPATIAIAYDAAGLPAGTVELDLVLAEVNGGNWTPIPGSGADTGAGVVSGDTTSLGTFGILPLVPDNVSAVPADGQNTLSWDPVPDANSYNVYWAEVAFAAAGAAGNPDVTKVPNQMSPFVHGGIANGTTYFYRVSAQKTAGEGGLSAQASAAPNGPTAPPGAPQNVMACGGDQHVLLSWNALADATMYNVYWNEAGGMPTQIPGVTGTSFDHQGLTNGVTYEYTLTGVNSVGEGAASALASAATTTLGPPANLVATAGAGQVGLSWSGVDCATAYRIHWNTTGSVSMADPALDYAVMPNQPLTLDHTGLTPGTTYFYAIASINELGEGSLSSPEVSATPTAVPVPQKVTAGDSGNPNCAILSDGTLKCWHGFPGDGSNFSATPVLVPGISNATDVSIAKRTSRGACVIDGGLVKCWNSSTPTPTTVSGITNATAIATGNPGSCAIDAGAVKCWGNGEVIGDLDLTTGSFGPASATPVEITALPSTAVSVAVSHGQGFVCAVLTNTETWCWGIMSAGLNIVDPMAPCAFGRCRPVEVFVPPNNMGTAAFVSVGATHACFVLSMYPGGDVACSGGANGQLFSGLNMSFAFASFSAGYEFNCGVIAGGDVICWGANTDRQLGDGTTTEYQYTSYVTVTGISNATDVSAGETHACAIDDGAVKCWGQYPGGPLPVVVDGL